MPDLQVSYCLWAPDHKTDAAAQKRLTLQNEHSAYFEALRAKGAILYGGAITTEDVQLPLTARPDFAGSVVVYKAASLEAVWELVEGDPFYKEGVWDKDAIKIVPVLSRA
ncbi:hypothetical protein FOMPIDRAFT_1053124 [Fomitopsis schrenkii]|uniref:YCII-related domain-containing protein n=1 Tax=Fomitopsis schrenkii TaxID=2126942 RepID=S8DVI2_FOMSC|nr:hypothetical protein FOMPIDRAFT_1053124 [Fomitopsis schrenkii]